MLRAAGQSLKWMKQGALFSPAPIRHSYTRTIGSGFSNLVSSWRSFSSQASNPVADFRGLYTVNIELDEPGTELWSKIEEKGTGKKPFEIIKEWKDEGNNLTDELLCNITYKLCARTRFKQALSLTNWLKKENNEPKSDFYKLMRLDVLSRHTPVQHVARPYFDNELTNKSETAYLMLLWGQFNNMHILDAEKTLEEMKQVKVITSGRAYVPMIKMFIKAGKNDKALEMFEEFEASGLPPSADLYWELLQHRDTVFKSIPAIQKAEEALPKIVMDQWNIRDVIRINAVLGKAEEVDRIWNEVKGLRSKPVGVGAIAAYDLLGNLEKVEEVSREVEETTKPSMDHYWLMFRLYAGRGDIEKALEWKEKMDLFGNIEDFEVAKPLIVAYIQKGDVEKAMEVYNTFTEKNKFPRLPMEDCVVKLNEEFAKRRDVKRAEEVMGRIPKHHTVRMYESLIRVYLSANEVPKENIRKRMQWRSLNIDGAETVELLQQLSGVPGYVEEVEKKVKEDSKEVKDGKDKKAKKSKKKKKSKGANKAEGTETKAEDKSKATGKAESVATNAKEEVKDEKSKSEGETGVEKVVAAV